MARKILPALAIAACLAPCVANVANADVHLVRRNGTLMMFNDVGSGWSARGSKPNDAYLVARHRSPSPFDEVIHREARGRGVDPSLVKTVMLIESNFNPRAISPKGARGLMQLMPATARQYGVSNIFEPLENIRGGIGYLADLLQLYSGDLSLTLAAYNAGSGAVRRYNGIPPYNETKEYVRRAMVAMSGNGAMPDLPGAPVIGGSFRGQLAKATPVTPVTPVAMDKLGRVLSNTEMAYRPVPILGRVTTP